MRSRYFFPRVLDTKNSKRQNFFTRTDLSFKTPNKQFIVASSVFACSLQILSRSGFVVGVLDTKIQGGRIFTRTDIVASSLFACSLQILSR